MVATDPHSTSDIVARNEIPDSWAKGARCPACGATPLQVVHLPEATDYFLCPKCELSFEVAANVGRIRIKNIPEDLGFAEAELRFRWVEPASLRHIKENRAQIIQQKVESVPRKSMTDDEVWERMLSLHRLGNKPKEIEFILIRAGATHEQAETAFIRLKQRASQDATQQGRKFMLVGGIASMVMILFLTGWFVVMGRISATLEAGLVKTEETEAPILPMEALEIIPDVVKPEFLKSGPAQVSSSGPASSRCPGSAEEAAQLFGGKVSSWQRANQPSAWQMVDTGVPSIIRVPAGMYAGYIENVTFMLKEAHGPATITNVSFIVITCE
jgi:hypothetical protein